MRFGRILLLFVALMVSFALAVPSSTPQENAVAQTPPGAPPATLDPSNFVQGVDNPYFPLKPGSQYVYAYAVGRETGRVIVTVTNETKPIQGVNATIVRETTVLEGEVTEVTQDWYAQDREGNVWYLGEDTLGFDRNIIRATGSWEAGVANARAGLIMHAAPPANASYYQEYAPNVAQDFARDATANHSLAVPFGNFTNVLAVRETDPIEGDVDWAYYAPGVGLIAEAAADGTELLRLVEIRTVGERYGSIDEWRGSTADLQTQRPSAENASVVETSPNATANQTAITG